jgi:hypothetical protein
VFEKSNLLQKKGNREQGTGNRQGARGKRQEARGKGQEARGKRQEARGKRQGARDKSKEVFRDFTFLYRVWFFSVHLLREHQKINYPILWDGHPARP